MISGVNRTGVGRRSIVMGPCLAMSGVKGSTRTDVARSLRELAVCKGGLMEQASPEGEPFEHLLISGDENCPVTVSYPHEFVGWDEPSSFLSVSLGVPVISLRLHDGDLWRYVLYVNGEGVDRFNPIPDYWSREPSPEERSLWRGDASVVAEVWKGIDAPSIAKYLVTWDLDEEEPGKAYESDRFPLNDCCQLIDFMQKLGLVYPIDDNDEIDADEYRFEVEGEV
jgi:hypothetical protein